MPLYEVAVLELPEKEKDKAKGLEKLVFGPAPVIASDEQSAIVNIMLEAAADSPIRTMDRSRMQVMIRPFA